MQIAVFYVEIEILFTIASCSKGIKITLQFIGSYSNFA